MGGMKKHRLRMKCRKNHSPGAKVNALNEKKRKKKW